MAESKPPHDHKTTPESARGKPGFNGFQNQLDPFMEEEKEGMGTAKDEARELQQQLDSFIDNLDAHMDEAPQESDPNTDFEMPVEVDPFGLEEYDHMPAAPESLSHLEQKAATQHIEKADANIAQPVKQTPSNKTHSTPAGHHHIISRLLIVSIALVAVLAWVVWDNGLLNSYSNLLNNVQVSHSENKGSAAALNADGNAPIDAVAAAKADTKKSLAVEVPDHAQASQATAKESAAKHAVTKLAVTKQAVTKLAVTKPERIAALAGADETAKPVPTSDKNATADAQKIAAFVENKTADSHDGSKATPGQSDQTVHPETGPSAPVVASTRVRGKKKPVTSTQTKPVQTTANRGEVRLNVAVTIGNIRSEPTLQGKVIYKLKKGATVTRLAERDGWYKIRLQNGSIAWGYHTIFESE